VTLLGILATAAVIVGADPPGSPGQAPFGIPAAPQINNPIVSPYLGLAQPGLNPGITYSTMIQPQLQLGNAVAANQQQIGAQQQQIGNLQRGQTQPQGQPASGFLQTGHATVFLNTGSYFSGVNSRQGR
jgi:hypothetical protein